MSWSSVSLPTKFGVASGILYLNEGVSCLRSFDGHPSLKSGCSTNLYKALYSSCVKPSLLCCILFLVKRSRIPSAISVVSPGSGSWPHPVCGITYPHKFRINKNVNVASNFLELVKPEVGNINSH